MRRSPRRARLTSHQVVRFLCAEFVLSSGAWAQAVVFSWLAFELTGSEVAVALFTAARLAPLLVGPFAGTLADRMNRKHLLLVADGATLATTAIAAVLAASGQLMFWHVVVGGFVGGILYNASRPVRLTYLHDLSTPASLSRVLALNNAAMMGARIIAPAVAGWLIAAHGVEWALWFCCAWFAATALALLTLSDDTRVQRSADANSHGTLAGFVAVARDVRLLSVIAISAAANFFAWPVIQALLPIFAEDVFHVGADGLGLLVAGSGFGALLGAGGMALLGRRGPQVLLYLAGTAVFGLSLAAFAVAPSLGWALLFMCLAGAASSVFNVLQGALTLVLSPPELRGRVAGVLTLSIGVLPVASLVHGAAASSLGVVPSTVVSGVMLAVVTLAVPLAVPGFRRR